MSITSWKREFYPITAKQAAKQGALAAAEHSLKKWSGALPGALKRHRGRPFGRNLYFGQECVEFDGNTCALCERYAEEECVGCPLAKTLGGEPCSAGWESPYFEMVRNSNPRPMIAALRKTVARLKRKAEKA